MISREQGAGRKVFSSVGRMADCFTGMLFVFLLAHSAFAAPFTFDDIEFWVGSGANRAALAIDWDEHTTDPPALVWGYRWDGIAKGRDMLLAIVAADDRLFAKLGMQQEQIRVYGLGYDANDDGEFSIEDETPFDGGGIAYGSAPLGGVSSSDPGDLYVEGWEFDFWHYGVGIGNPFDGGQWLSSPVGIVDRVLANGVWDGLTFEGSDRPPFDAFAENPSPAPSPYPPGDFNRDTFVDAADYALWKSEFGSTHAPNVDGNGNGVVDAADYTIWRDHCCTSPIDSPSTLGGQNGVPEPATWLVLTVVFLHGNFTRFRHRKERI